MADIRAEMAAFLKAQRAEYARLLPQKVAALEAAWQAAQAGGSLHAVERAAHAIHGSAGTYGFREPGEQAGRIEAIACEALEAGGTCSPAQAAEIAACLAALRLSLPAAP